MVKLSGSTLDAVRDLAFTLDDGTAGLVRAYRAVLGLDDDRGAALRAALFEPELDAIGRADRLSDVHAAMLGVLRAERAVGATRRQAQGAVYTPSALVEHLLDVGLEPVLRRCLDQPTRTRQERALLDLVVLDPACGTGNFLVAAAERIAARLAQVRGEAATAATFSEVAIRCIRGIDLDDAALEVLRARMSARAGNAQTAIDTFVHADALALEVWSDRPADVVIGNPPFLAQRERATALGRSAAVTFDRRHPGWRTATTDAATLFLTRGLHALAPGGRLAMVQPLSFFASQGSAAFRTRAPARARLVHVWASEEAVFGAAGVRVGAVVLQAAQPTDDSPPVTRTLGAEARPASTAPPPRDAAWGSLVADLLGAPAVHVRGTRTLNDLAELTADYRQHFYGLVDAVRELREGEAPSTALPRLVLTGHIDPAANLWGATRVRFAGRAYERPVVELATLEPRLRAWAERRCRPHVVLATQGRVLEAFADLDGDCLNTVPTITVVPRAPGDLARVLAALLAPQSSAWAFAQACGTALSAQAIKLSARQAAQIPLPREGRDWDEASVLVLRAQAATTSEERRGLLCEAGLAMGRAYGGGEDEGVVRWWVGRW